jgi:hypothetical protein
MIREILGILVDLFKFHFLSIPQSAAKFYRCVGIIVTVCLFLWLVVLLLPHLGMVFFGLLDGIGAYIFLSSVLCFLIFFWDSERNLRFYLFYLSLQILFAIGIGVVEGSFKVFLSVLVTLLFFSPIPYILVFTLTNQVFLPRVRIQRFETGEEYKRLLLDSDNSTRRESAGRLIPNVLVLYPRAGESFERWRRPITIWAIYTLLQNREFRSQFPLFADLLNYKNIIAILGCFTIFCLFCFADQFLIEKAFVSGDSQNLLGGLLTSSAFWKGVHVVIFLIWFAIFVKILLASFPESFYTTVLNALDDKEIVSCFSFFYWSPEEGRWMAFFPPLRLTAHDEERKITREFITAVLMGFILAFLLTTNLWNYN